MPKKLTFNEEVFKKMMVGLDMAANAVGGTIGPKGRNVFLDDPMTPTITNDGATIANRITLEDPEENAGAYVIKNVASQQNDDAGDGTTTVSVLTQAIIHECLKRPENPMFIRRSLKDAGDKVLSLLIKQSTPIKKGEVEKVALISAEDKKLARMITEIIDKLGDKAVINVEEARTMETNYEIVDGYEAHVGYMSPHFVNDKKTSRAVYEDIHVLVAEKKISGLADLTPIFTQLDQAGITKSVIVCEDIADDMLGVFVGSNIGGVGVDGKFRQFKNVVIRATGPLLQDIAGVVGAKPVSDSMGLTFQNLTIEDLGHAKKVVCSANKTVFLGNGKSAKEWASKLESQAANEPNQFTAKSITKRVAKLLGGIAVLKIAAPTDFEKSYLKLKAEDAVKATTAALEEGVVEGGGMALWRIAMTMRPKTVGEEILKKAMTAPFRKIVENGGKDYTEIVLGLTPGNGYDAKNDVYCDMLKAGIIDPAKVERCALENAVSAASSFISTFAVITDIKEDKK